jgi:hypothetical protein
LNCMSFSSRNFFTSWQPDEFIIHTQIKPKLVESDDVILCSITLDFEHSHSQ